MSLRLPSGYLAQAMRVFSDYPGHLMLSGSTFMSVVGSWLRSTWCEKKLSQCFWLRGQVNSPDPEVRSARLARRSGQLVLSRDQVNSSDPEDRSARLAQRSGQLSCSDHDCPDTQYCIICQRSRHRGVLARPRTPLAAGHVRLLQPATYPSRSRSPASSSAILC